MEPIANYNSNYNNSPNNNNSIESSQTLSAAPISLRSSPHSNQNMKRSTGSGSGSGSASGSKSQQHQQQQHQQQQLQQLQEQEQHHQITDCLATIESPKPNQVGTVLLYGIPIVSLYIESQERLCLAQISNTLLKTFSYNEIHNRRVALGITCVQCTPVQLEILRRAGAMPVSSRRCGMITRREAERLCKSFLGDNAPPRLPDDFAFSVHHECAWGCRGSFLPSRYNSSRAKCIKCSYCGLFFSPNKFIFHSHRIGPSDKYVQPDAANFNSWRRHMKLSGNPPEEITHAWEDVKAMFNGGTRKRLMANSPTASTTSQNTPSPPKRLKENELSQPLMHAAVAAAAVATANVSQFPMRPLNIHQHHQHSTTPSSSGTTTSINSNSRIPAMVGTTAAAAAAAAELSSLPFSRNFMMDYMWHAHQNKSNTFQFPNYALPFIKRPPSALIFSAANPNATSAVRNIQISSLPPTNEKPSTPNSCNNDDGPTMTQIEGGFNVHNESKSLSSFYSNSAFKPVIQAGVRPTIAFPSPADISIAAAAVAAVAASAAGSGSRGESHGGSITSLDDDQRTISHDGDFSSNCDDNHLTKVKECLSSDDEMVDIETTEEEKPHNQIVPTTSDTGIINVVPLTCIRLKKNSHESSLLSSINIKLPDSPPIEIENSDDGIAWDGIMKKEHSIVKSNGNSSNYRSVTPEPSLLSHSPASSLASGDSHPAASICALNNNNNNSNNNNNNNNNSNNNNNNNKNPSTSPPPPVPPPQVICPVSPINDRNKHQTSKSLSYLTTTTATATTTVTAAAAVAIASAFGHHHHPALVHHHHLPGHNNLHNLHTTQHHHHQHHQHYFQHITNSGGHLSTNDTPSPPDTRICNNSNCNNNNNNSNNNNSSNSNNNSNNRSPTNSNNSFIINNSSGNNNNLSSNTIIPNSTVNNSNSAEFWSVARLSFDRQNEYHRFPSFYRHHHDITKHFQSFRYHGHETTTQTNGIG